MGKLSQGASSVPPDIFSSSPDSLHFPGQDPSFFSPALGEGGTAEKQKSQRCLQ